MWSIAALCHHQLSIFAGYKIDPCHLIPQVALCGLLCVLRNCDGQTELPGKLYRLKVALGAQAIVAVHFHVVCTAHSM